VAQKAIDSLRDLFGYRAMALRSRFKFLGGGGV
jgi:hypothetical protein